MARNNILSQKDKPKMARNNIVSKEQNKKKTLQTKMSWLLHSKICAPSWVAIIIGSLLVLLLFAHAFCSCRKNYLEGLSTIPSIPSASSSDVSGNDASGNDASGNQPATTSSTTTPAAPTTTPAPTPTPAKTESFTNYNVYNKSPYNDEFSSVSGWTTKVDPSSWAKQPTESSMNSHIVQEASTSPNIDPAWQTAFNINKMHDNDSSSTYSTSSNDNEMFVFAKSTFKPECCKNSGVSNSMGCAC